MKKPWQIARRSDQHAELSEDFGFEWGTHCLSHPVFQKWALQFPFLERLEICCLPRRGLGAAQLARALVAVYGSLGFRFSRVFIDWPKDYQEHLQRIAETFPTGLLLCEGKAFAELRPEHRVDLLEPLDPRRVLVVELQNFGVSLDQIFCLSPNHSHSAVSLMESAHGGPSLDEHLSTVEMLRGGCFSFLEARVSLLKEEASFFSETEHSENPLPGSASAAASEFARSVLQSLIESSDDTSADSQKALKRHLLVLDEAELESFPDALEEQLQTLHSDHKLPRTLRQKPESSLRVARISPEQLAQYAACNGPVVREFLKEESPTLSPLELQTKAWSRSFQRAAEAYSNWTKTEVTESARRETFRYMHLLAKDAGRRFPNQFEMLLAAQSAINSNFSFEWLKDCRDFPKVTDEQANSISGIPILDVPLQTYAEKITVLNIERFETLQQRKPRPKLKAVESRRPNAPKANPIDESKYADNKWVHQDHPFSCSFPQEDADMEDFAFDLVRQAREISQAKDTLTLEMSTSMGDGLDIRETLRNWHMGTLMIREELSLGRSDIGAIVFQMCSSDDDTDRFEWRAFWQAEHHDKSHLMFYATPFQNEIIGPGIAKSEFGGFSVLPLSAIAFDPWHDPFIRAHCQHPTHALLLASALGTLERHVLYIADRPPPAWLLTLLRRSGKGVLFQKSEDVPQERLRRLKTFHILAEAGVRSYAHKYIRKDTSP